jgi:hypothetical protein
MRLRQVLRRLARAPMFTALAAVTLPAGIGANSAIFSVINGVLLKPLPYPHADDLIGLTFPAPWSGPINDHKTEPDEGVGRRSRLRRGTFQRNGEPYSNWFQIHYANGSAE